MTAYTLPKDEQTSDEYPTRCTMCDRPVQRLSMFPKDRCIDCHAMTTPFPSSQDVIDAWS